MQKYQDKPFRSAIDGDLELGDEQKPDETDSYQEGFAFLKEALGDKVDQVKASTKLKTHPVCLSSGQGITFEMEKYFTAVQPELGMKAKRILEINVDHPAFAAFEMTATRTRPKSTRRFSITRPASSRACPSRTPPPTRTWSAPSGSDHKK